ncbi:hypothetical protein BsLM_0713 [Bacillus sp. LM 4-2]|nr:hypothetical protein BsLM_0713 [Bacillus sp. LM 4-2]NDK02734.1 hypothetical protein [Bacillus subtilis subsp. subtilis]
MAQLFTAGLFLFQIGLAIMETEKGLLYKKSAEQFNNLLLLNEIRLTYTLKF